MANTDRDRHLTTEELSAFLDKQLSPAEQDAYDAHLTGCQQCRRALARLQQTVTLLRAMPQPTAPRSFTLSPDIAYLQEPAVRRVEPTKSAVRRGWYSYARRSLRTLSTIAAVIGFFFLLSGLLPLLAPSRGGLTSATTTANPANPQYNANAQATHAASTSNQDKQATACAGVPSGTAQTPQSGSTPAVAVKTPQAQRLANKQNQSQAPPIIDLNVPLVRQELGLILLLIGIIGIFIARRWSAKQA